MKNKPWMLIGFSGALLALVIAATVTPGLRISEYPNTTSPNANDLFLLADITSIPRTNRNYKWSSLTNFVNQQTTNNVHIVGGTNILVTTNVSGPVVTFTVNIASNLVADGVWTNNQGIIHPRVSNGQETNSIQIYTNGGLSIGANTLPFWVTPPGAGGETLVSMRDSVINFNEIFIGVPNLVTNEVWQDFFMHSGLNRRRIVLETPTEQLVQDQYVDDGSNFVFGASGTTFGNVWKFQPGSISSPQYFFDTVRPVATNVHLFDVNNFGTNQVSIYGDGKVNIVGQITNQFLTASKTVATDANKGLVSIDTVDLGAVTNVVTNYVNTIQLRTNFINLSVQAAKIPTTNFPAFDTGYQNWELVFFPTNESGSAFPLPATWQFVVPSDYATNSLQVYMLQTLVSTNGPSSSNTIWRASVFKATPSDSTDVRIGSFGTTVWATNTWGASTSNTNKIQSLTIDLSTNSLIQAGDLAIVKIERVNTNETYRGSSSLVGIQLRYSRP